MTADDHDVADLYRRLIDAWNARDAKAMAGLYAPRGGQVGFDGSTYNRPAEIEQALTPIFADHPTARFVTIIREIRPLGDTAAILRAVAGMVPPGERTIKSDRNAIQTLVASRNDGGWQVEMFHNTPAHFDGRHEVAQELTRELQQAADRELAELQPT